MSAGLRPVAARWFVCSLLVAAAPATTYAVQRSVFDLHGPSTVRLKGTVPPLDGYTEALRFNP